eukprot:jgi/Mesvir1/26023/Mv22550-RA.1
MDLYMVRTCAWAGDMVLVISRVAYMEDEDLLAEILERYNGRGGYLNAVDEIVANGPRERPARPSLPPPPLLLPPHPLPTHAVLSRAVHRGHGECETNADISLKNRDGPSIYIHK